MYFLTNYAGLWPHLGMVALLVFPLILALCLWAGLWIFRGTHFTGWPVAAVSAGTAIVLIIGGLLIVFLWPVTTHTGPLEPPLPGYGVLFKLAGGFALTLGGLAALLSTLALWGIHELVRNRPRPNTRPPRSPVERSA